MPFTKITSEDLADKGVVGLPDTPNLSVTALQKKFDEIATDVIVPKFNGLVDELDSYEETVNVKERVKSTEITDIKTDEDGNILVSRDNGKTWSATSSSGHVILDGNDTPYPPRGRMQFSANVSVEDVPEKNATFIQVKSGEKGEPGDSATITVGNVESGTEAAVTNVGSPSDAIFDFVLPKGDSGSAATIQVGTVVTGTNASVTNRGTSSNAILDFIIPKGEKGDAGTSFKVLGMYATYEDLIAAHPTGNRGDAYSVGDSTDNVIYNWDSDTRTWKNLGGLKGAKGDDGKAATLTVGTVTTLEPDQPASVENVGTTENAIFNMAIPKGAKGDIGNAATIAIGNVTKGDEPSVTNVGTPNNAVFDITLPKGDKGDPTTVNGKSGESIQLNGNDITLIGYRKGQSGEIENTDTVNVAFSKLSSTIEKNEERGYLVNKNLFKKTSVKTIATRYYEIGQVKLEQGKTYTLSGCPSGGSRTTYMLFINEIADSLDFGTSVTFACTETKTFSVVAYINETATSYTLDNFKPQIEEGTEATPYQPYSMSNVELTDTIDDINNSDCISYNLLKCDIEEIKRLNTGGTWSGNSYTLNGVTFKVNDDMSVTASGTTSTRTTFTLKNRGSSNYSLPSGDYILNGCPKNASSTTHQIQFQCTRNGALYSYGSDTGNGLRASVLSTDTIQVVLLIDSISNGTLVFKPMIRKAEINNDEYKPYIPSNVALSKEIDNLTTKVDERDTHKLIGTSTTREGAVTLTDDISNYKEIMYNIFCTHTNGGNTTTTAACVTVPVSIIKAITRVISFNFGGSETNCIYGYVQVNNQGKVPYWYGNVNNIGTGHSFSNYEIEIYGIK